MPDDLTLNEYQRQAAATAIYPGRGTLAGMLYATLGLTGEAGELANKLKKVLRDSAGTLTEERKAQILGEIGDVLWYVAMAADEMGSSLASVAAQNVAKLAERMDTGTLHGQGDDR